MTKNDPIRQLARGLFEELGWKITDCSDESFGPGGTLGRETRGEVVLVDRLTSALKTLNPKVSEGNLGVAAEALLRDRKDLDLVEANREVYLLLRDGYRLSTSSTKRSRGPARTVRYVDWERPEANDFLVAADLRVTGEIGTECCDLVAFLNGIPFVVVELVTTHADMEEAFERTLAAYERAVPRLFWYNAFSIISNGSENRVGPVGAAWEHYGRWRRVASEEEEPRESLETMVRGTCDKARLLDLVESSLLFVEAAGGPAKMLAKNHQYLGVNAVLESLEDDAREGRLGMFWHASGSGKGVSMILLAQKILRKIPGKWTFVLVTDREELEEQIYGRFAAAGLVQTRVRACGSEELRRTLKGQDRYVFVPLQQFRGRGAQARYPSVSARSDVVVMVDEAHRPQYDRIALNMRTGLPNAVFVGFTSTPLLAGEESTRQVFGDYASIYNYRESIDDGVTLPVYHENRVPEVNVAAGGLDRGFEQVLKEMDVDPRQECKLESESGSRYYTVTDDERLDTVARDIVRHFADRGYLGKALVVCIDRITAIRMFEKVRGIWALQLAGLRLQSGSVLDGESEGQVDTQGRADARATYWERTDMAVVVPVSRGDVEEFRKKGVDLVPHVQRMQGEDLVARFNDPSDPLRMVFTCASWVVGLDTPACSTVYVDKPMRDHSLVQTVSRTNRTFRHKPAGLVVDYLGVFGDPRRVMTAYGAGSGSGVAPGDIPVLPKSALLQELRSAMVATAELLRRTGSEPEAIRRAAGPTKLHLVDNAIDGLLCTDARKEEFLALARRVLHLYRAAIPDPATEELASDCALYALMIKRMRTLRPELGMPGRERGLVRLLADRIETEGYADGFSESREPANMMTVGVSTTFEDDTALFKPGAIDLGEIDFETVAKKLPRCHKYIETERLRGAVEERLGQMVRLNPSRSELPGSYASLIGEMNAQNIDAPTLLGRLVDLVQEINVEAGRAAREELREDELALFDLLRETQPVSAQADTGQAKSLARQLADELEKTLLPAGWRDDRQARASVRTRIQEVVENLPGPLTPGVIAQKTDAIFQHVYDSYLAGGRSVYTGQ